MKIDSFLKCLSVTGIDTGISILGLYSFASGDSKIIFNQIHSSGENYYNNYPYRNSLPLIYNGVGDQTSGIFNKSQFYQISDIFTSSFSALISLDYSGCLNSETVNYLLASTNPNPTGTTSGVYLGISPSNRLFVKAAEYAYTIPKEIGVGDFAFFNVTANRFLNFGIFSLVDNKYYGRGYDAGPEKLEVKDLCIGGALSYPPSFTGYSGKLDEIYLFSGTLDADVIKPCADCSFSTGYSNTQTIHGFEQSVITGSSWSGIYASGVTGTQKALAPYQKIDGGTGYIYYDSGESGSILLYQSLIPKTDTSGFLEYFSGLDFNYDDDKRYIGTAFDLYFDAGLNSGDVVEIYTYKKFNDNVGLDISGVMYPTVAGNVQLFCNGLAETKDVDFTVKFNDMMSGFVDGDIFLYDIPTGNLGIVTVPYSSEYVSATTYNPLGIKIYGVSGASFPTSPNNPSSFSYSWPYDIYLNGQKLTSGINFDILIEEHSVNLWQNVIILSGNDVLDFDLEDAQEFKLVDSRNYIQGVYPINYSQYFISGVTGFSEQVWVNGLRQSEFIDYVRFPRCRFCSGQYNDVKYSFSIFNTHLDSTVPSNAVQNLGNPFFTLAPSET